MRQQPGIEHLKRGLPPISRPDARVFILGSLPGDASLAARQYYAHPRNQFWRLLGGVLGEELTTLAYAHRLERLAERRVGLWDVVGSAVRQGSLDQAIRSAGHNRIEVLLRDYPDLRAIAFNGSAASAAGRRLLDRLEAEIDLIDLPSSSPANTRPLEEKAAAWARLALFLEGGACPPA